MTGLEIAVIGMAAVVPGAKNYDEFWTNLKNGVESVSFSSDEEFEKAGVSADLLQNPNFVKARGGVLENKEYFDAAFFDYTPREAEIMDPQIRIFHEICWQALEDAGYNPDMYDGPIGIYAGASLNYDWQEMAVLSGRSKHLGRFETPQLAVKDFLCTRVAYKLNLKGPAVAVYTACSTSLTAIHLACRALLMGECGIALAGGVSISLHQQKGYLYQEGMVNSPDGRCRAFDARARGIIGGEGSGVVVLKKLKQAAADNDHIRAVVLGSVVNNDGNQKVGFTAPSVESQSRLVRMLFHITKIEPESISYVEAHGTGTVLGDPIEVEALKQAFATDKKGFCRIGSVKTNIGHLDSAAGVVGFIKTVLALEYRLIPPSLNFENPNPKIDFENSPFRVNTQLLEWKNDLYPLRAGVNSLGVGGTNVYVFLEERPGMVKSSPGRKWQLIFLSSKTASALKKSAENLAEFLKKNPRTDLADMAYTLHVGRKAFKYRRKLVCSGIDEAIEILTSSDPRKNQVFVSNDKKKALVFMFPGIGGQYVNMGLELYRTEPVFRQEMDLCFKILKPILGYDIKEILYPGETQNVPKTADDPGTIDQTEIAQLVLFIFEYALARLLMTWGIIPTAMIGYSVGEYTAACTAGVFSLEDALKLVALRGRLIGRLTPGAMLSVPLPREKLQPLLADFEAKSRGSISIAIDNGPSCIVAGPVETVSAFENQVKAKRLVCMRLKASHAIHSKMMDPILKEIEKNTGGVPGHAPKIPYISNVFGDWITPEQAMEPGYWARHSRETVRFAEGINRLTELEDVIFMEVGPGRELCGLLANQINEDNRPTHRVLDLVGHPRENIPGVKYLLNRIGQLWLWGCHIDGHAFYRGENRYRIPLPTYPFEGKPYWIDTGTFNSPGSAAREPDDWRMMKKTDLADWFYYSTWIRVPLTADLDQVPPGKCNWLIFDNAAEFSRLLGDELKKEARTVITVMAGPVDSAIFGMNKQGSHIYTINPQRSDHYDWLLEKLKKNGAVPDKILHLWNVSNSEADHVEIDPIKIERALIPGFYSLVYLVKAIGKMNITNKMELIVVTGNLHEVTGDETLDPSTAPVLGPLKVIPQEYPFIVCRNVDIVTPKPGSRQERELVRQLANECRRPTFSPDMDEGPVIAYRNNLRWVQQFRPVPFADVKQTIPQLKENGVYLVTGGTGKIGLALAEYLVRAVKARLILIGRRAFPPRDQWEQLLAAGKEDGNIDAGTLFKIRRLSDLEKMGGKILTGSVDLMNREQVQDFIVAAEEKFGPVNGVIHAAGYTGQGLIQGIEQLEQSACSRHFIPKIYGLLTLEKVLGDKPLDFCLLTSSLSTILGGLGFSLYAAANHFMDAFAYYYNRRGNQRWISINWADWNFDNQSDSERTYRLEDKTGRFAWRMTPAEGVETFRRILFHCRDKQVAVSTVDLVTRIDHWVKLKSLRQGNDEKKHSSGDTDPGYNLRPRLESPYIKPSNHLEQMISNILQDFLGFEQVGIDDNFFELGATSLNLIQINQSLREQLRQDVPVVLWFEYPTVRTLAAFLSLSKDQSRGSEGEKFDRSQILRKGKNKMKQMNVKSGRRSHEMD